MADITAARVKALRDKSGVGMMDCKKALQETGGDMEAAVDWLRTMASPRRRRRPVAWRPRGWWPWPSAPPARG